MELVLLGSAGFISHSATWSEAIISETPFMVWYVLLTFCSLLSVEGLANKTALNTPTQHQNALNFRTWVMACVEDFKKGSNRSGSPYAPFLTPFPPLQMFEWLTSYFHKTQLQSWPQSGLQSTDGLRTTAVRFMSSHPSSLRSIHLLWTAPRTWATLWPRITNSKLELPSESVCGGGVTDLVSCYISRNMQSQFPVPRDIKNYFRITIDLCRNCARAVLYSGFPVFVTTKYRPVRRSTQPIQWKIEDFFLGGKMTTTWSLPIFSV
jgi:hypothetical protein